MKELAGGNLVNGIGCVLHSFIIYRQKHALDNDCTRWSSCFLFFSRSVTCDSVFCVIVERVKITNSTARCHINVRNLPIHPHTDT